MLTDLRYAIRRLADRPVFAGVTILTLAAGIGLNTTVFQLVNTLVLRPLPGVTAPGVVAIENRQGPAHSYPTFEDLRRRSTVTQDMAAARFMPVGVNTGARSEVVWGFLTTGNYFQLLGVTPATGRFFTPQDDEGEQRVAVLSHRSWQTRFGGDPHIIGRTVRLNGVPFTITGVAPAGFLGTEMLLAPELWVPFSSIQIIENRDWRKERGSHNAWVVAALKPGVAVEQANAELAVLSRQIAAQYPGTEQDLRARAVTPGLINGEIRGAFSSAGAGLLLMALLTLVVACTNLSNLMLAQAAARRREVAVRLALGAGRGAIVRLMLAETLVLAFAGGGLGWLLAVWLRDLFTHLVPVDLFPINSDLPHDWRVTLFAAGVTLFTAFACGWIPAWRSSVLPLADALKTGAPETRWRRFSLTQAYVAVQVVASMVLLATASLSVDAWRAARVMKLGLEPEGAVVGSTYLEMRGYDRDRGRSFQRALLARMRAHPGLENTGLASSIPLSIDKSTSRFVAEGKPIPPMAERLNAFHYRAEPGFFRAIGTRLLEGRDFEDRDGRASARVAIVNRTFADKLWPGEAALGKRFRFGGEDGWMQVVGIVEPGKHQSLIESPAAAVWMPLEQSYEGGTVVVVRSPRPPAEVTRIIREEVRRLDPEVALMNAGPLSKFLDFPMAPVRIVSGAVSAMGALAAFLCGLGLYGVLANWNARRTREFGIRVALGAAAGDIVRAALAPAGWVLTLSAAAGFALAFAVARLFAQAVSVDANPWSAWRALPLMLLVMTIAAARPVWRALRVSPAEALRDSA